MKRGVPTHEKMDLRVVENAGRFSFMSVYPRELRSPGFLPSQEPPGFHRASYAPRLEEEIAAFLLGALSGQRPGAAP